MKRLWQRLYNAKPVYSIENTAYLLFFAEKINLGKRNAYYDCKEGLIYRWQMHIINFFKNRSDTWTLEEELQVIEDSKHVQI